MGRKRKDTWKRQVMLAVSPETRQRLRQLAARYEAKYHLGRGGIPHGLVDPDKGITMDRLINHLLDLEEDHKARTDKANAKKAGARKKAPDGPVDPGCIASDRCDI
jgi:hypothetical protein